MLSIPAQARGRRDAEGHLKKDESQKDQQQFNTMYMYRHENVRCAGPGPGFRALDGDFRVRLRTVDFESLPPENMHPLPTQYELQPLQEFFFAR